MSLVGDLVKSVVDSALSEILKKTTGKRKRSRRRSRTLSATERLSRIEKLKPARRQTSRKRTVRARAKPKRLA